MANLTVGQANDIGTVIHYLASLSRPYTGAGPAEKATEALLRLRAAMQAKLMAGPMEDETRLAIAAVDQLRAEHNRDGLEEVFGFWNYRNPWTPEARAQMMPVAAADAGSLKGLRNRLYRAYRTRWQPADGGEGR